MTSNTHSTDPADALAALAAVIDRLDSQDLTGLTDTARAQRIPQLRRLLDRLEGHWLQELADLDARGAAGADQGVQAASTASWLRNRLHLSANAASTAVRTARALFRGPLAATGQALTAGEISPDHAAVLAAGTHELPHQTTVKAEPVLLEAARHLDPHRLRKLVAQLRLVTDPDNEQERAERHHAQRWLRVAASFEGMVVVDGLLEPEAGATLAAALEPLARPVDAGDSRTGGQRTADALTELARRALEGGRLPQTGGVRPQLLVTVDLDTLLGRPGSIAGDLGGLGTLDPEGCRRLACDSSLTRVLVTRQPLDSNDLGDQRDPNGHGHGDGGGGGGGLTELLRTAMTRLPVTLCGAPTQPLEVGRASRVVTAAQRAALAVRDHGCVFPDCTRPLSWCEGHHLVHWLDGGPTDLDNLALVCRAHHRAIHEGGWQLIRGPDGRFTTATPPHRRRTAAA
jgi:hypothetical protein